MGKQETSKDSGLLNSLRETANEEVKRNELLKSDSKFRNLEQSVYDYAKDKYSKMDVQSPGVLPSDNVPMDYIKNRDFTGVGDFTQQLYDKQTTFEVLRNSIWNAGTDVVINMATAVPYLGTLAAEKMGLAEEGSTAKILGEIEQTKDVFHATVYHKKPDSMGDILSGNADFATYMETLFGLAGSTVEFLGTGLGAAKALSLGSKLTMPVAKRALMASAPALSALPPKAINAISKASQLSSKFGPRVSANVFSSLAMSRHNYLETYNELYLRAMSEGKDIFDPEILKEIQTQAEYSGALSSVINMVDMGFEFTPFLKGLPKQGSKAADDLLTGLRKEASTPSNLAKTLHFMKRETITEGLQEVGEDLSAKYFTQQGLENLGIEEKVSSLDFISDYLTSAEAFDTFMLGSIGGGLMSGPMALAGNLTKSKKHKEQQKQYVKELLSDVHKSYESEEALVRAAQAQDYTQAYADLMSEAKRFEDIGDTESADAKYTEANSFREQRMMSTSLYTFNRGTASHLYSLYEEMMQDSNPEQKAQLEQDLKYIRDLEKRYNKNIMLQSDPALATAATVNEVHLKKDKEHLKNVNNLVNQQKAKVKEDIASQYAEDITEKVQNKKAFIERLSEAHLNGEETLQNNEGLDPFEANLANTILRELYDDDTAEAFYLIKEKRNNLKEDIDKATKLKRDFDSGKLRKEKEKKKTEKQKEEKLTTKYNKLEREEQKAQEEKNAAPIPENPQTTTTPLTQQPTPPPTQQPTQQPTEAQQAATQQPQSSEGAKETVFTPDTQGQSETTPYTPDMEAFQDQELDSGAPNMYAEATSINTTSQPKTTSEQVKERAAQIEREYLYAADEKGNLNTNPQDIVQNILTVIRNKNNAGNDNLQIGGKYTLAKLLLRTLKNVKPIRVVVNNEVSSKASYSSATNTITLNLEQMVREENVVDHYGTEEVLLEEILHAVLAPSIGNEFSGNKYQKVLSENLNRLREEVIESLPPNLTEIIINEASELNGGEEVFLQEAITSGTIKSIQAKIAAGQLENKTFFDSQLSLQAVTEEILYNLTTNQEFAAGSLLNKVFKEHLNTIQTPIKKTFLDRFIETVVTFLKDITKSPVKNSVLQDAVKSTIALVNSYSEDALSIAALDNLKAPIINQTSNLGTAAKYTDSFADYLGKLRSNFLRNKRENLNKYSKVDLKSEELRNFLSLLSNTNPNNDPTKITSIQDLSTEQKKAFVLIDKVVRAEEENNQVVDNFINSLRGVAVGLRQRDATSKVDNLKDTSTLKNEPSDFVSQDELDTNTVDSYTSIITNEALKNDVNIALQKLQNEAGNPLLNLFFTNYKKQDINEQEFIDAINSEEFIRTEPLRIEVKNTKQGINTLNPSSLFISLVGQLKGGKTVSINLPAVTLLQYRAENAYKNTSADNKTVNQKKQAVNALVSNIHLRNVVAEYYNRTSNKLNENSTVVENLELTLQAGPVNHDFTFTNTIKSHKIAKEAFNSTTLPEGVQLGLHHNDFLYTTKGDKISTNLVNNQTNFSLNQNGLSYFVVPVYGTERYANALVLSPKEAIKKGGDQELLNDALSSVADALIDLYEGKNVKENTAYVTQFFQVQSTNLAKNQKATIQFDGESEVKVLTIDHDSKQPINVQEIGRVAAKELIMKQLMSKNLDISIQVLTKGKEGQAANIDIRMPSGNINTMSYESFLMQTILTTDLTPIPTSEQGKLSYVKSIRPEMHLILDKAYEQSKKEVKVPEPENETTLTEEAYKEPAKIEVPLVPDAKVVQNPEETSTEKQRGSITLGSIKVAKKIDYTSEQTNESISRINPSEIEVDLQEELRGAFIPGLSQLEQRNLVNSLALDVYNYYNYYLNQKVPSSEAINLAFDAVIFKEQDEKGNVVGSLVSKVTYIEAYNNVLKSGEQVDPEVLEAIKQLGFKNTIEENDLLVKKLDAVLDSYNNNRDEADIVKLVTDRLEILGLKINIFTNTSEEVNNQEDSDDKKEEELSEDEETASADFSDKSFRIDISKKLSLRVKRIIASIKKVDVNGNPIKDIFNNDVYYTESEVYKQLVPIVGKYKKFDKMVEALSKHQSNPVFEQVLDIFNKLNTQEKLEIARQLHSRNTTFSFLNKKRKQFSVESDTVIDNILDSWNHTIITNRKFTTVNSKKEDIYDSTKIEEVVNKLGEVLKIAQTAPSGKTTFEAFSNIFKELGIHIPPEVATNPELLDIYKGVHFYFSAFLVDVKSSNNPILANHRVGKGLVEKAVQNITGKPYYQFSKLTQYFPNLQSASYRVNGESRYRYNDPHFLGERYDDIELARSRKKNDPNVDVEAKQRLENAGILDIPLMDFIINGVTPGFLSNYGKASEVQTLATELNKKFKITEAVEYDTLSKRERIFYQSKGILNKVKVQNNALFGDIEIHGFTLETKKAKPIIHVPILPIKVDKGRLSRASIKEFVKHIYELEKKRIDTVSSYRDLYTAYNNMKDRNEEQEYFYQNLKYNLVEGYHIPKNGLDEKGNIKPGYAAGMNFLYFPVLNDTKSISEMAKASGANRIQVNALLDANKKSNFSIFSNTHSLNDILDLLVNAYYAKAETRMPQYKINNVVLQDEKGKYSLNPDLRSELNLPVEDAILLLELNNEYYNNQWSFSLGDPAFTGKGKNSDFNSITTTFDNYAKRGTKLLAPGKTSDGTILGPDGMSVQNILNRPNFNDTHAKFIILKDAAINLQTGTVAEREHYKVMEQAVTEYYNKKLPDRTPEEIQELVDDHLAGYRDINSADAQGYTTLEFHLGQMAAAGKITKAQARDLHERAYDNRLAPEDYAIMLDPTKPVYYNQDRITIPGIDGQEPITMTANRYLKLSTVPLIPGLGSDTKAEELRLFMEKNGIEIAAMESAVKEGITPAKYSLTSPTPLNKQLEGAEYANPATIKTIVRDMYRIQQEVGPEHKSKIIEASQLKNYLVEQLDPNLQVNIFNQTFTQGELGEFLKSLYAKQVDIQGQKLRKELDITINDQGQITSITDPIKLRNLLIKDLNKRGKEDVIPFLNLNKEGTDFAIPLYLNSNSLELQSTVMSLFNKRVIKIKHQGGAAVQASSVILRQDSIEGQEFLKKHKDQIIWTGSERTTLPVKPGEPGGVLVTPQALGIKNIKDFLREDGTFNENKVSKEALRLIAFRRPYESPASSIAAKVVGFLPSYMGETVVVDSTVVTQMGSDFDVDKLYYYHNAKRISDQYLGTRDYKSYDGVNLPDNISELQAMSFEAYWKTLTNPENFADIIQAQGYGVLPDIAEDVSNTLNKSTNAQETYAPMGIIEQARIYDNNMRSQSSVGWWTNSSALAIKLKGKLKAVHIGKSTKLPISFEGDLVDSVTDTSYSKNRALVWLKSAAVDDAKEQIFGRMSLDINNYKSMYAAIALGLDIRSAAYILNSPIVKEYLDRSQYDSLGYTSKEEALRETIKNNESLNLPLSSTIDNIIKENFKLELLRLNYTDNSNKENAFYSYLLLETVGDILQSKFKIISLESKDIGKNAYEFYNKFENIKDSITKKNVKNGVFIDMDSNIMNEHDSSILTNSYSPLNEYLVNSNFYNKPLIDKATAYYKKDFPDAKLPTVDFFIGVENVAKGQITDNIADQIIAKRDDQGNVVGYKDLFAGKESIGERLNKIKSTKYKDNPLITKMTAIPVAIKTNKEGKEENVYDVRLGFGASEKADITAMLQSAFLDMLTDPKTSEFAIDLIAFELKKGFHSSGYNSIARFIPMSVLESMSVFEEMKNAEPNPKAAYLRYLVNYNKGEKVVLKEVLNVHESNTQKVQEIKTIYRGRTITSYAPKVLVLEGKNKPSVVTVEASTTQDLKGKTSRHTVNYVKAKTVKQELVGGKTVTLTAYKLVENNLNMPSYEPLPTHANFVEGDTLEPGSANTDEITNNDGDNVAESISRVRSKYNELATEANVVLKRSEGEEINKSLTSYYKKILSTYASFPTTSEQDQKEVDEKIKAVQQKLDFLSSDEGLEVSAVIDLAEEEIAAAEEALASSKKVSVLDINTFAGLSHSMDFLLSNSYEGEPEEIKAKRAELAARVNNIANIVNDLQRNMIMQDAIEKNLPPQVYTKLFDPFKNTTSLVSGISKYINAMDASRVPIVQYLDRLKTDTEGFITQEFELTFNKLKEAADEYTKVYKRDYSQFFEVDSQGNVTGNVVKKYNSTFYRELEGLKTTMYNSQSKEEFAKNKEAYVNYLKENAVLANPLEEVKDEEGKVIQTEANKKYKEYLKRYNELKEDTDNLVANEPDPVKKFEYVKMLEDWQDQHDPLNYYKKIEKGESVMDFEGYHYVSYNPNDTFINPQYAAIMADPISKQFYQAYVNTMERAYSYLPKTVYEKGSRTKINSFYIPQLEKVSNELLSGNTKTIAKFLNKNIKKLTMEKSYAQSEFYTDPATGLPQRTIPVFMLTNRVDPESRSTDLFHIATTFNHMAVSYKYKKRMEPQALLAYSQLLKLDTIKTNARGKTIVEDNRVATEPLSSSSLEAQRAAYTIDAYIYNNDKVSQNTIHVISPNSKLGKMTYSKEERADLSKVLTEIEAKGFKVELLQKEVTALITENKENPNASKEQIIQTQLEALKILESEYSKLIEAYESRAYAFTGTKTIHTLNAWMTASALGLNVGSAIRDAFVGTLTNIIEAGTEYDLHDLKVGLKKAFKSISGNNSIKDQKIFDHFRQENEKTYKIERGKFDETSSESSEAGRGGWLFYFQKVANKINHDPIIYAMLKKEKVTVDGKEVSLYDAIDEKGNYIGDDPSKNPFATFDENGNIVVSKYGSELKAKIDYTLSKNHGDYSTSSKKLLNKSAYHAAFMRFRTWMGKTIASRYAPRGYNQRAGKEIKGRYLSIVTDENDNFNFMELYKNMQSLLTRAVTFNKYGKKEHFTELDEQNMAKNVKELQMYMVMLGLYTMFAALSSDDDDEEKSFVVNFTNNMLDKAYKELSFYWNPHSFFEITRNPLPMARTMEFVLDAPIYLVQSATLGIGEATGLIEEEKKRGRKPKSPGQKFLEGFPILSQYPIALSWLEDPSNKNPR